MEQLPQDQRSGVAAALGSSYAGVRGRRLVEVCVRRLEDVPAVESLSAGVFAAVRQADRGAVLWGDYRHASPLSAEVATAWSRDMRRANGSIVRSGILLDPSNTMFNLQVARVVRCAVNDARRLFTSAQDLCDWLGQFLAEDERASLRRLIGEHDSPVAARAVASRGAAGAGQGADALARLRRMR